MKVKFLIRKIFSVLIIFSFLFILIQSVKGESTDFTYLGSEKSCMAHLMKGRNISGTYIVDPDGTGGEDSFQVYCDMVTDGGGWTLLGRIDQPSMWNVPSSKNLVHPVDGLQHWSSQLGDVMIIDFRVMVSTTPNPTTDIKSHWYYSWDLPITLKYVMGQQCCDGRNGLMASAVKDLLHDNMFSHTCSRHDDGCASGPIKEPLYWTTDYSNGPGQSYMYNDGSFSFDYVDKRSGQDEDSTSFIGCDDNNCCICWGPDGVGTYCTNNCGTINGGTKSTTGYGWFYIRDFFVYSDFTNTEKSCMVHLMKGRNISGTYIIDPDGTGGEDSFQVYCDMVTDGGGWTLAAKFTNQDSKNWINAKSSWTDTNYYGTTIDLSIGADAKSKAWGTLNADEFLLTDNLNLGKEVITTSNCLEGKTLSEFFTGALNDYPDTSSLNNYKICDITKTYVPNWGAEPDWGGNGPSSPNLAVNNGEILIAKVDSTDTAGIISNYVSEYTEADVGLAPSETPGFGTSGLYQDIGGPTSCNYSDVECRTEYPETVFLMIRESISNSPYVTEIALNFESFEIGNSVTAIASATDPNEDSITEFDFVVLDGLENEVLNPSAQISDSYSFIVEGEIGLWQIKAQASDGEYWGPEFTKEVFVNDSTLATVGLSFDNGVFSNTEVSAGSVVLLDGQTNGAFTTNAIDPVNFSKWGVVTFSKTTPENSTLTIDVLKASDDSILIADVKNGQNISATVGSIPIKLRANFTSGSTPSLDSWDVSYYSRFK
ncbi:MAG: hypothetical protein J7L46_05805, partial [Bacteroidales bacterium]|nr:hypothetical protein [Bacteroidales bacterium]